MKINDMIIGDYPHETYFIDLLYYDGYYHSKEKEVEYCCLVDILRTDLSKTKIKQVNLAFINKILIKSNYNTDSINNMLHSGDADNVILAFEIILEVLKANNIEFITKDYDDILDLEAS